MRISSLLASALCIGAASAFAPPLSRSARSTSAVLNVASDNNSGENSDAVDGRRSFLQNTLSAGVAAIVGSSAVASMPDVASASGGATAGKYT